MGDMVLSCPEPGSPDSGRDRMTGLLAYGQLASLRIGSTLAVADLRNFRRLNEEVGHRVGDQILCVIAQRLEARMSPRRVFRLGGDEFAVELEGGLDRARAEVLGLGIKELIEAPIEGLDARWQVRIGMILAEVRGPTNITVVRVQADRALLEATRVESGIAIWTADWPADWPEADLPGPPSIT